MNETPFTYDELDEIFRGDGHNDFIGLSNIDGLIAALVAGPAVVPKAWWLPEIFAGHMPSSVPGSPESRAAATIMTRYAQVEDILAKRPKTYQPILMHHLESFVVGPWALGFMMGMGLGQADEAWMKMLGSRRRDLLPILAATEIGRQMLADMSCSDIQRIAETTEPVQIAGAVLAVHRFYKSHRLPDDRRKHKPRAMPYR